MKLRCLFGHKWRELEWFKPRDYDDRWWKPDAMCMRCFKEKRKAVIRITSIEGPGIGYYGPPYYEGQPPPKDCASWKEYRERMNRARDKLIERAR
jgi:hypothetical protein